MIGLVLFFLVLIVVVLAFAGLGDDIYRAVTKSDKPHPPKITASRRENLRRGEAYKQAVHDWKTGQDSGARHTYPEKVGVIERLVVKQ